MTEPRGMGDVIASQVRKYRLLKNWSVKRLAEECERLGAPQLTAASLANIERGQDETAKRAGRRVLVEELTVLARALQVPPIMLLFPLGLEQTTKPLPKDEQSTWAAVQWFMGAAAYPDDPDLAAWRQAAAPLDLYDSHSRWVTEWQAHQATGDVRQAQLALAQIHLTRRSMSQLGLLLPPLPEGVTGDISALPENYLQAQEKWLRRANRELLGEDEGGKTDG